MDFDKGTLAADSAADAERAEEFSQPAPGIQFTTHTGAGPRLSEDFERIVASIFDLPDAMALYGRLEQALKLGDQRTDLSSLTKALDEAEDHARLAHKLYCNAKVEETAFELDFDKFQAPIWADVTAKLQEQKDQGSRSKMITDADVKAGCAEHYPDAYREHGTRAAKTKLMVEHTKKLAELWTQRCSSLQSLLSNRRK